MLVLSRRTDEMIILRVPNYPPITLTVVEVRALRGRVRLGITAPRDTTIHRAEIDAHLVATGEIIPYTPPPLPTETVPAAVFVTRDRECLRLREHLDAQHTANTELLVALEECQRERDDLKRQRDSALRCAIHAKTERNA
jgi:carbon storage regulator CsrA